MISSTSPLPSILLFFALLFLLRLCDTHHNVRKLVGNDDSFFFLLLLSHSVRKELQNIIINFVASHLKKYVNIAPTNERIEGEKKGRKKAYREKHIHSSKLNF